jgi:hypothetical protein
VPCADGAWNPAPVASAGRYPDLHPDNDLVLAACAISAGVHAALVPSHLQHEPRIGLAFLAAVGLLVAVGAAVARRPGRARPVQASALLFAGLITAYAAAITSGIPVLAPHAGAVDGVAVMTKLAELVGLVFALKVNHAMDGHRSPTHEEEAQ